MISTKGVKYDGAGTGVSWKESGIDAKRVAPHPKNQFRPRVGQVVRVTCGRHEGETGVVVRLLPAHCYIHVDGKSIDPSFWYREIEPVLNERGEIVTRENANGAYK